MNKQEAEFIGKRLEPSLEEKYLKIYNKVVKQTEKEIGSKDGYTILKNIDFGKENKYE